MEPNLLCWNALNLCLSIITSRNKFEKVKSSKIQNHILPLYKIPQIPIKKCITRKSSLTLFSYDHNLMMLFMLILWLVLSFHEFLNFSVATCLQCIFTTTLYTIFRYLNIFFTICEKL